MTTPARHPADTAAPAIPRRAWMPPRVRRIDAAAAENNDTPQRTDGPISQGPNIAS